LKLPIPNFYTPPHSWNLAAGDAHQLVFYHVRYENQPTISVLNLCHKKDRRPWSPQTRVIQYEPFGSLHNAQHFSEATEQRRQQNMQQHYSPTNRQYLKIYVRFWIWSQNSPWFWNRIVLTKGFALLKKSKWTRCKAARPNNGFLYHRLILVACWWNTHRKLLTLT
jgi:hypothetical protein